MENDPMQFRSKGYALGFGVIADPVQAYVDFSCEETGFGQVKCDDICIVVVFEILAIDLQNSFVRAKNVIHRIDPLLFFFEEC